MKENERWVSGFLYFDPMGEMPEEKKVQIVAEIVNKNWKDDPDWDSEANTNGYTDLVIEDDSGLEWEDRGNVWNIESVIKFVIKKTRAHGWKNFGLWGYFIYGVEGNGHIVVVENNLIARSLIVPHDLAYYALSVQDLLEIVLEKHRVVASELFCLKNQD